MVAPQVVWGRRFWSVVLYVVVCAITGCGGEPGAVYVWRESLLKLPERHQEQIHTYLDEYFGDAASPRHLVPADGGTGGEVTFVEYVDRGRLEHGMRVYRTRCVGCHGVTGDGRGAAAPYLDPKPRDYRRGIFKFTSTPRSFKPRRDDLLRIIRHGAKGTSMPSFRWMSEEDIEPLVDYVVMLSQRGELEFQLEREAELELLEDEDLEARTVADYMTTIVSSWGVPRDRIVLPVTRMPAMTPETIGAGHVAFLTRGCAKCHGEDGRGQTQQNVGKDDWGNTVKAADLQSGMLHGGRRPIDIYRRIYAGINGTPMPAFAQALKDEPETIWYLVHYVLALVENREIPPLPPGVLKAPPTEAEANQQEAKPAKGGVP